MKLPYLHRRDQSDAHIDPEGEQGLEEANYDAQSDLALPSHESGHPSDGFVPFAGELAPAPPNAGYDALRDTGIDPG